MNRQMREEIFAVLANQVAGDHVPGTNKPVAVLFLQYLEYVKNEEEKEQKAGGNEADGNGNNP